MPRGRKPIKIFKLIGAMRKCKSYETGKSIEQIAEEIYGKSDMENKIKARQQIRYLRKWLKNFIYKEYGQYSPITLFSNRKIELQNGKRVGEYRYWYHSDTNDLQRVWDKLKDMDEGIKDIQKDIKIAQGNAPEIDHKQLERDIKKRQGIEVKS